MTCGGGVEAALSSVAPVGVARARRCLADAARDVTAPAAGAPARVRAGDDGVVLVVLVVPRRLLHRRRRRASRGVLTHGLRLWLPAMIAQRWLPVLYQRRARDDPGWYEYPVGWGAKPTS